jgi:hypothetical protein
VRPFALAGRHCEDSRLSRISAAIHAAIRRVVGTRLVDRVGVCNSGHRDVHEPELQQLRRVGHAADANCNLRHRRHGRPGLCAERESRVAGSRAVGDDKRQLQQWAAGEQLRVDGRHLRRDHWIDMPGSQIKTALGDLFGQGEQRLGNGHPHANHRHLAVDSPATRDRIRGRAQYVKRPPSYHRGP